MKDVYIGIVYEEPKENYVNVRVFSNHFNNENPSLKVYKDSNVQISLHDEIAFEKRADNNYYFLANNIKEVFYKVLSVQYSEDLNKAMFIIGKNSDRLRISLNNIPKELQLVIPGDNLYVSYNKDEIIRVEVEYQKNI